VVDKLEFEIGKVNLYPIGLTVLLNGSCPDKVCRLIGKIEDIEPLLSSLGIWVWVLMCVVEILGILCLGASPCPWEWGWLNVFWNEIGGGGGAAYPYTPWPWDWKSAWDWIGLIDCRRPFTQVGLSNAAAKA
jgi:hypothetical protein